MSYINMLYVFCARPLKINQIYLKFYANYKELGNDFRRILEYRGHETRGKCL